MIQRTFSAAHHAKGRSLFVAPGASHPILTDLRSNAPDQLDHLLRLMTDTLTAAESPE